MLDESLTVLLIIADIVEIALCVIVLSEINDDDDDDKAVSDYTFFVEGVFFPFAGDSATTAGSASVFTVSDSDACCSCSCSSLNTSLRRKQQQQQVSK